MPWGRVDDQHYRHEKLAELDDELRKGCIALFWLAISWCNDRLTDGRVPQGTVRILGADAAEAEELVRVGLWERDGRAYRIHDYLHFNKSKAQVIEERIQRTLAGKAGAAARWHPASDLPSEPPSEVPSDPASDSIDEMHGGSDAPVSRTPSPVTPSPASDARIADDNDPWGADETDAVAWLAKQGCYLAPGNGFRNHLITLIEVHRSNAVIGMFDRLASGGMKRGDTKGYVFGAKDALNAQTRPNLRSLEKEDDSDRAELSAQRQAEITLRKLHENGAHQETPRPNCPLCKAVAS